jgi:hypothetical protein
MTPRELLVHITAITRPFDKGANFAALSDAERRLMQQKIIGATAAPEGLAAELERTRASLRIVRSSIKSILFLNEIAY